jgi:pimeloyl-ACP methyl ester carboxylesterase
MNTSTDSIAAAALDATLGATLGAAQAADVNTVRHERITIDGVNVFYREAGPRTAPTVLLLHGFGASSYMFRDLIPTLASRYHVVAPDLPGFGLTTITPGTPFAYTFDNLAAVIDAFTVAKGMDRYAMYVFDYGAPVGWRLAAANPRKITALVSQNGNAYEAGLSVGWADMRKVWADPSPANRDALRKFNTFDMIKWQYTEGVKDPSLLAPEPYMLAHAAIERHGEEVQLDLISDYGANLRQYPMVHAYFRSHQPPTLAIWGRNDPFFLPPGATAFKHDNPNAEVHFLDTGHFAIETHGAEIGQRVLDFLNRSLNK